MEWNIIWGSTRFSFRGFFVQRLHMWSVLFSERLFANYADGSTPFNVDKNIEFVVNNLEQSTSILFERLSNNYINVRTDKSYLVVSGNVRAIAKIDNNYIESKKVPVLLGIAIDSDLTFERHINNICKRASKKLNVLARVVPYRNIQKRRIIMKSFVPPQFGYYPLILMFNSSHLNNKINSIHERALRITYQNHISTFQELLNKDNSVSIHCRNFQVLATEMLKICRALSPNILREIFVVKISSHNLRGSNTLQRQQVHSVYHGTELLSFLRPKTWNLVPLELKQLEILEVFKFKIKKCIPFECPCRLCRAYIQ